jgi:hypothetical protein
MGETTQVVVFDEGWVAAAFAHHQPPLYFWPSGQQVQAVAHGVGRDLVGGSLEDWQAAMARTSAALLAAGFRVVPDTAPAVP